MGLMRERVLEGKLPQQLRAYECQIKYCLFLMNKGNIVCIYYGKTEGN